MANPTATFETSTGSCEAELFVDPTKITRGDRPLRPVQMVPITVND